jgi:hypothetical protein
MRGRLPDYPQLLYAEAMSNIALTAPINPNPKLVTWPKLLTVAFSEL